MGRRRNTVNIVLLFLVQFLERTAMVGMRTVITPYAKTEFMASASLLGVLTGVLAVASMTSRISASGLMRRFSYLKLIHISLFAELVAYCLYLTAGSFRILMAVRLLNGFFTGVSGTAILALAGTMFSVEQMGLGLGIFGYSQMAAVGIAPALPWRSITISVPEYSFYPRSWQKRQRFSYLYLSGQTVLQTVRKKEE